MTAEAHKKQLLEERSALLRRKFNADPPALDEINSVRLRAIRYELDIIEFDSPAGQALDARYRELVHGTR